LARQEAGKVVAAQVEQREISESRDFRRNSACQAEKAQIKCTQVSERADVRGQSAARVPALRFGESGATREANVLLIPINCGIGEKFAE
jgi:hypothetical protein